MVNLLGTPNESIWPGFSSLAGAKKIRLKKQPYNNIKQKYHWLSDTGIRLINDLLTYDPKKRISAIRARKDKYFHEKPHPVDPEMMPTYPHLRNSKPQVHRAISHLDDDEDTKKFWPPDSKKMRMY